MPIIIDWTRLPNPYLDLVNTSITNKTINIIISNVFLLVKNFIFSKLNNTEHMTIIEIASPMRKLINMSVLQSYKKSYMFNIFITLLIELIIGTNKINPLIITAFIDRFLL